MADECKAGINYYVELVTAEHGRGRNYYSGTDDHVFIQIRGTDGATSSVQLTNENTARADDKKKNLFEAGDVDKFTFDEVDVGEVTSIVLTLKARSKLRDDNWNPKLVTVYIASKKVHYTSEECNKRIGSSSVELKIAKVAHTSPMPIDGVDLNIAENTKSHRTNEYDITKAPEDEEDHWELPQLVVRRGQRFTMTLQTSRPLDGKMDAVTIVMKAGKSPSLVDGTLIKFTAEIGEPSILKPKQWGARIKHYSEDQVILSIMAAADCPVGKWDMNIVTRNVTDIDEKESFNVGPVYILFNAWCQDDQIFLEDEDERDEYVLNDRGRIFVGNWRQLGSTPWNFAQFEDIVLDCVLELLDKVDLKYKKRGNPIEVCRAVSAIVNVQNDSGLLTGNWSGDYEGGTSPLKWPGSHSILREYWRTKDTVKYAQCWVFSGVCTTVCRALGIPTRSVTNFSSAHDTDGSVTIDKVFYKGEEKDYGDFFGGYESYGDSIWNFHVWNEAWMTRPDLPGCYGGWQAFDATPQEASPYNHIYCAGPASIKAIKEGDVNMPYDARFIFAEVNADEIYWYFDDDEENYTKKHFTRSVGKKISTQYPRKQRKHRRDERRLDVTNDYKYREGSEEERKAVMRAALFSMADRPDAYEEENLDVAFEIKVDEDAMVGSDFDIVLRMTNQTKEERNVLSTIKVSAVRYNGMRVPTGKVITGEIKKVLEPEKCEGVKMSVQANKYLPFLTYDANFQITVVSKIEETGQWDTEIIKYRLLMPDIDIKLPDIAKLGESVTMKVAFKNPLPKPLTKCEMTIEGAGLQKPHTRTTGDIKAHGEWKFDMQLKPKKSGEREVTVSFMSAELQDIQTSASMFVEEPIVCSSANLTY